MKHKAVFMRSDDTLLDYLARELRGVFAPRDRIAIKLHMGEPGNRYFIPADFARRIVRCVGDLGAEPFIFDSPVVYQSPRGNETGYRAAAAAHGFEEQTLGCPVVVSNRSVPAAGTHLTYHVCADLLEADGVLLLTHVKGHLVCGMGGAIKNVGMGCLSKESKGAIHGGGEPAAGDGCTQCGECVAHCPTGNITLEAGGPVFGATWCPGCSNCVLVCPVRCIRPRIATFDELLAEGAVLAHARFGKRYAVNVCKNIAEHCDCMADGGALIAPDAGFVCASDMLTADIASIEMIARTSGREDVFAERHKHSPWVHVRAAANFMGRDTAVSISELT